MCPQPGEAPGNCPGSLPTRPRLPVLSSGIRHLDRILRSALGITEFCDSDACILRVALRRSQVDIALPDGTQVRKSDQVIELHFWNEHLPRVRECGSPFGWAVRFRSQMRFSLNLLADFAARERKFENVRAFSARMVLPLGGRWTKCASVAEDLGFTVTSLPRTAWGRVHDALENFLIRALVWAFHPAGLPRRRAVLERVHWWISAPDLIGRYAGQCGRPPADKASAGFAGAKRVRLCAGIPIPDDAPSIKSLRSSAPTGDAAESTEPEVVID